MMNDSKIGLSGDFTSPYVEASARPVQTAYYTQNEYGTYAVVPTCPYCASPVHADEDFTCGCDGEQVKRLTAENERLSFENQSLREKIVAAGYRPDFEVDDIEEVELKLRQLAKRDIAENTRLTEALGKCSQAREAALGK